MTEGVSFNILPLTVFVWAFVLLGMSIQQDHNTVFLHCGHVVATQIPEKAHTVNFELRENLATDFW